MFLNISKRTILVFIFGALIIRKLFFFPLEFSHLNVGREITDGENEERCEAKRNIVFLKIHKTGSSTIANIFNRLAEKYNLTMATPRFGYHFLWPLPFEASFVQQQPQTVNILVNHARFAGESFKQFMPQNTKYVTILRNPLTQYISLFKFMNLGQQLRVGPREQDISLEYFLDNGIDILKSMNIDNLQHLIDKPTLNLVQNPQLFDLGFETSLSNDKDSVQKKIKTLNEDFYLVLIMEYFDESLVLLKRKLCLTLDDVIYFKHNMQITKKKLTHSWRNKISRWVRADLMLYDYFNDSFWRQIKTEGETFWEEVRLLQQKNEKFSKICLKKDRTYTKPYPVSNAIIYENSLKDNVPVHWRKICVQMVRSELEYIDFFRKIYQKTITVNSSVES